MTFLSTWRLVLLVIPIALAVAYLFMLRRRQEVSARFTSVDLLASVAPKRTGWQRHIPWVALLAAVGVGAIAFAQPAWAMKVPKERATIMLTLDTSASMSSDDVSPTRLAAAQQAARNFVSQLPATLQVGLVTFDRNAKLALPPTTDRAALTSAIDAMAMGTGTATGSGLDLALQAIAGVPPAADGTKAPAAIVLMSDGTPTVGSGNLDPDQSVQESATRAKDAGVPVTTIAFGTDNGTVTVDGRTIPVPYDPAAMASIAEATGGSTFTAQTASELGSVYDEIGGSVGYDTQTVELTVAFAGLAFLLASLAAAAALLWNQRIA